MGVFTIYVTSVSKTHCHLINSSRGQLSLLSYKGPFTTNNLLSKESQQISNDHSLNCHIVGSKLDFWAVHQQSCEVKEGDLL